MKRLSQAAFEAELERIRSGLRRYAPLRAWLFGSYARGDYNAASDVDLLIVKETDLPFVERAAEVWRACESGLSIEPLVYTPNEFERMLRQGNPLIERALQEGVLIYGSQPG
jgi:predicted nucleotidyltransferase